MSEIISVERQLELAKKYGKATEKTIKLIQYAGSNPQERAEANDAKRQIVVEFSNAILQKLVDTQDVEDLLPFLNLLGLNISEEAYAVLKELYGL